MNITLTYKALYATVERSLSVIGKRSTDDNGNRLYTDVTLGSHETLIMTDYFKSATANLATETALFVSETTNDGTTLSMPEQYPETLLPALQQTCEAYCVAYALHSWFTVTAPSLAAKYEKESQQLLTDIVRLTNEKQTPAVPHYPYPVRIIIRYPVHASPVSEAFPPDNSEPVGMPQLFNEPVAIRIGQETEISYTLLGENDRRPIDDILVRCDSPCCHPLHVNCGWVLRGIRKGKTVVTLFSRHNDQVFAKFTVDII